MNTFIYLFIQNETNTFYIYYKNIISVKSPFNCEVKISPFYCQVPIFISKRLKRREFIKCLFFPFNKYFVMHSYSYSFLREAPRMWIQMSICAINNNPNWTLLFQWIIIIVNDNHSITCRKFPKKDWFMCHPSKRCSNDRKSTCKPLGLIYTCSKQLSV